MINNTNKRKKILLVGVNGDSSKTGFAARVIAIARSLIKNDYDVTILKFYPLLKSQQKWKFDKSISDLNIIELPIFPISKYSFLRHLSFLWANGVLHVFAKLGSFSLIQAECHEAGYVVLKNNWTKLPVVVDFHGAASEEASHRNQLLGLDKNRHLWLEKAEETCLFDASALFYVSKKMHEHLLTKHNLEIIPNSFLVPVNVEEEFFIKHDRSRMRNELGISDDDILLVYSGGAQEYQCVKELIEVYKHLRQLHTTYKLLIMTLDVDKFKEIFNLVAPDCDDVIYRSATKQDVSSFLSAADISFLLRKMEILNIVSCPTKFGEYLACGLPVITTNWAGHAPYFVKNHGVGLIVDIEQINIELIHEFTFNISDSLRSKCIDIARENLMWQVSEESILKCYSKLNVNQLKN